jgi:hypothetical protein
LPIVHLPAAGIHVFVIISHGKIKKNCVGRFVYKEFGVEFRGLHDTVLMFIVCH